MKTVLIDDESNARETLRHLLTKYVPQVEIVGEADSVESGIACLQLHDPDLVFMDIEMPFGSGFDILDETKGMKFKVIFVTAFNQYAVQAFRFSAVGYLMKPIRISDLKEAVAKLAILDPDHLQKINVLTHNISVGATGSPRLILPDLTGFFVVELHTIVRCEGERNYTRFHFADQNSALVTRTLKEYDDLLSGNGFFRIHQSHLVNLSYVKRYIRGKGGEVEMSDKAVLPLARHRKDDFLSHFNVE